VKKSRPFSFTKHLLQNGKNSPQQKSLGGAPSEEGGGGEGEEKCQGFERSVNHVDWHFVKKMKDEGSFQWN
jgi:hypothetical protein